MLSFEALQVVAFLIPGFLASTVLDMLVVRREKKELARFFEAMIFSLVVYALFGLSGLDAPVHLEQLTPPSAQGVSETRLHYHGSGILLLLGLSIALAAGLAVAIRHELYMQLARLCRISDRMAEPTVWQKVLRRPRGAIVVHFRDGRSLAGYPHLYSDTPEEGCLYLVRAKWIVSGKYFPVSGDGILLTPASGIQSIEFLMPPVAQQKEKASVEGEQGQVGASEQGAT